jgi:uncharacterized protein YkwD
MRKKIRKISYPILKVVLGSTILTLTIVILASIYYLGYLKGVASQAEEEGEITASSLEITPIPTTFPTPTSKPRTILPTQPKKVTYGLSVSWGGPELWDAVNKKRLEYGVNPLKLHENLCTIASIRLNELIELGKLDGHEGFTNMTSERPDLKWIFDNYGAVAEFLAVGGKTPEETVSLWENTLGHRQLLSGGEYVWGCIYSQNTFAVAIAAY